MITCLIFLFLLKFYYIVGVEITPDVRIEVEFPPPENVKKHKNETIEVSVNRGNNLVLECSVLNKNMDFNVQTYWKLYPYYNVKGSAYVINNGMTSRDHSRYKVGQGKQVNSIRLEVLNVDETYAGVYACEVQYSGTVQNVKAERMVTVYAPPNIAYTEYKRHVEEGKDIEFECRATGLPKPTTYWKRIGGSSNIIKDTGVVSYGEKLNLQKVDYNDVGVYSCFAENIWGTVRRHFMLSVIHKPVVSITPNKDEASQKLGCAIQLTCLINSNPQANNYIWTSRLKQTLTNDERITTKYLKGSDNQGFYILRIYPSRKEDFEDDYSCKTSNTAGSDSQTVKLKESNTPNQFMSGPNTCSSCQVSLSVTLLVIYLIFSFMHII